MISALSKKKQRILDELERRKKEDRRCFWSGNTVNGTFRNLAVFTEVNKPKQCDVIASIGCERWSLEVQILEQQSDFKSAHLSKRWVFPPCSTMPLFQAQ
ncbi:hypothetical protein CEXT_232481 [Caerostris extrusa]|uniref:Uncharacterized protein n=1 Tax=Caerostris extrusa TaxID=172846 RepID=A0AAV4X6T8_CAEEX|nr:hypothetical protein CEXT_232481 [Caerostris extrusa]